MFCSYTNGILIPVREIDGMIHDLQIRLDTPLKNEGSDKPGAKYIWFSSSSKPYGTGPGSPIQFLGDRNAGRVYITEGYLKSYIAHALSGKTFIALASANAAAGLEKLLQSLAPCGTRTVIHFCISKTEHCIRTPHVSVIFDGVIVARKYPFVKTARLINYAAQRKGLLSHCTIPISKARHMAQSPSCEAARNTACKCLQHLIECG